MQLTEHSHSFSLIIYSSLSFFLSLAPSQVSELRAEKVEQRSVTLVWRESIAYTNSSRTEYEIKYYEKVQLHLTSSTKVLRSVNLRMCTTTVNRVIH